MSLSRIAKAKIKTKAATLQPRKIEKIIDVAPGRKLEEIMSRDHKEFTVEEKLEGAVCPSGDRLEHR